MLSHPEFDEKTTATEAAAAFASSIEQKVVLVVGVSPKSLGESLVLSIASQRPSLLILASRSASKLKEVAAKTRKESPNVKLELIIVDLASQTSIRQAANDIGRVTENIDVMINNAAVNPSTHEYTKEGIEMQFGTNHIGFFLLTNLILPKLLYAAQAAKPGATRIINVTSQGHVLSPVRFHDYNFEGKNIPSEEEPPAFARSFLKDGESYNVFLAYGQSKAANILFSKYLSEHLKTKGVGCFAVHPGSIWTNLSRDLTEEQTAFIAKTGSVWKTQDQGAAPMVVAAFDPALNEPGDLPNRAIYFKECQVAEPAAHANDMKIAERLWRLSEELVGQAFELAAQIHKV